MAKWRTYTLAVEVLAPATTSENEVATALNAALDEPPCYWGEWEVGAVTVISVEHAEAPATTNEDATL